MDHHLSRRRFLSIAGAGAGWTGLVGMSACQAEPSAPSPAAVTKTSTIRMAWWGSTERHKRTQDALTAFTKRHPDIKVDTQFSGSDGYWEKLGNEAKSGGLPDVIQMDRPYLFQYIGSGYLRPLDEFVPKVIDLTSFSEDLLVGGRIDKKLYGVNNGINSAALVVNLTMLKQLGLELPDYKMTWADFGKLAKQIGKKAPDGTFGSEYGATNAAALECWLRQRGKASFTPDGGLGFDAADLTEWIAYWEDLRKAKGTVPADLQATGAGDIQNRMVARRKAAFDFTNSNQLIAYSSMLTDELALHMFPQGPAGSKPGQYLKPSQLFCISSTTQHPQEAAILVNALVTDPEVTAILGSERGVPPSTTVRVALKQQAGRVERQTYDYIDFISGKTGPLPAPSPPGGNDVTGKLLTAAIQQVAFGKATISQTVTRYFADAGRALKKS